MSPQILAASANEAATHRSILCVGDLSAASVIRLLARYELRSVLLEPQALIPGSYWGDREAGLLDDAIYFRADTPLHSVLHEACHFICMDRARRARLDCDAGGDYDEENAVCYLQILLADQLPGVGRERMCADMDAWGYTFRLGSAKAWFEQDAEDAREWLRAHGLIEESGVPTFRLRSQGRQAETRDSRLETRSE